MTVVGLQFEVALACAGSASVSITAPPALSRMTLMMGSPPELSPPPELKSSLDPSDLVVRELTGENRADVAEKIDFLGLGLAIEGNREN